MKSRCNIVIKKWLGKSQLIECSYIHQLIEERAKWFYPNKCKISYHPSHWSQLDSTTDEKSIISEVVVVCFLKDRGESIADWIAENRHQLNDAVLFVLECTDDKTTASMCHFGDKLKPFLNRNLVLSQLPYEGEIPWLSGKEIIFAQCWLSPFMFDATLLKDYS